MDPSRSRPGRPVAGFSLVELLIVTVVLGIIMTITIATLANALDKSRQGATIADMRNLGTALEAYSVDHGILPKDESPFDLVAQLLVPYANARPPVHDHWGHLYRYQSTIIDYTLRSYGKDGAQGDILSRETRNEFFRDIVFSNGQFAGLPH